MAHQEFQPELRDRLPQPLARLYRRAFNARSGAARHGAAFYLLEAAVKLAASAQIAIYLQARSRDPKLEARLAHLALPSFGHWVEFLREVSGRTAAQEAHPFPVLAGAAARLREERTDLSHVVLALDAMAAHVESVQRPRAGRVRVLDFFQALVTWRNHVIGHGG
jgi:hypothetical protein